MYVHTRKNVEFLLMNRLSAVWPNNTQPQPFRQYSPKNNWNWEHQLIIIMNPR